MFMNLRGTQRRLGLLKQARASAQESTDTCERLGDRLSDAGALAELAAAGRFLGWEAEAAAYSAQAPLGAPSDRPALAIEPREVAALPGRADRPHRRRADGVYEGPCDVKRACHYPVHFCHSPLAPPMTVTYSGFPLARGPNTVRYPPEAQKRFLSSDPLVPV